MSCDAAFRFVARRCLMDMTAYHQATCHGNPEALHQMRIALTRLRTTISFFSPMVSGPPRTRIRADLKWLQAQLGAVRDLDVAIERLKEINKRPQEIPNFHAWRNKRVDSHRHLARALHSVRYRHLIESAFRWIERGSWSTKSGKIARRERTVPISAYSARKLARWQKKLLKKSDELSSMSAKKRHRLRMMNKKLCYSIEFLEDLFADKKRSRQQAALKYLRKAQKSLGEMNDDVKGWALAADMEFKNAHLPSRPLLQKRNKQLIQTASTAYRKLAALKPIRP
ncbi:MAG TPA: CHAD domain-containing protein [Rhodopseudomonas sp.]|uniref:CHAD domain-containing protein n=1 Tax=Rhodopseudomonas sp. TaxID=1078 RepID=UPI002ED88596